MKNNKKLHIFYNQYNCSYIQNGQNSTSFDEAFYNIKILGV